MVSASSKNEACIMKKVALVIVNWNGHKDTLRCLESVGKMRIPDGVQLETIVVDNGSTDGSVSILSKAYPTAAILALGDNLGFTGGNNTGIQYALKNNADYVWLLNNDTIVDSHALSLVDAFQDETVGVAGSKIYFAPGHEYHTNRYAKKDVGRVFWYAGGLVDWDNMYASHKGVDEVDDGQYDVIEDTTFVTGCSMMIRREVFQDIGMLDNRFYLYLEDLDFGLRAKKASFRLVYFPKSVVWHVNAGSSGGAGNSMHEYYMTRNRLWIGMKYASIRTRFALLREAIRFLKETKSERSRAVKDFFLQRWGKQYEPKKTNT